MSQASPDEEARRLSLVSAEMVRIYKEHFGRGPKRARAEWAGTDVLVVTLEETLTQAERKLLELGQAERLRETRLLFQYLDRSLFCAPIERLTGRRVRAFISGLDTLADVAAEMFVLAPEDPSRDAVEQPPAGG